MLLILGFIACGPGDPSGPADTTPVTLTPGVAWTAPSTDVRPDRPPAELCLDPGGLAALDAWAFSRQGDDVDRKGIRTNALIVMRHGSVAYERYARDTTADTPLLTWSVSKSLTNTLVGVAVREGKMDLNAPLATYVPELDRGRLREIRVTDALRMSSGLAFDETYETSPVFSSVMHMLYTTGRWDMAAYTASLGLRHPPGTIWSYASGNTNLLMRALKATMPEAAYAAYPWTAVFEPLGIEHAVFERDAAGTFVGSSYWYAPARGIARWAQLYLQDGVWAGQRILPEGWVRYTTTLAPAFATTPVSRELREDNPGAQWYVNVGDASRGLERPIPTAPTDTFGAIGHWGKRVWVIPSQELVVVRMGDDRVHRCEAGETEGCEADPAKVYSDAELLRLVEAAIVPSCTVQDAPPPEATPAPGEVE